MADERMTQKEINDFFKKIKMGDKFTIVGDALDILEELAVDFKITNMEHGLVEIVTNKTSMKITRANATSPWMIFTEKTPTPVEIINVRIA